MIGTSPRLHSKSEVERIVEQEKAYNNVKEPIEVVLTDYWNYAETKNGKNKIYLNEGTMTRAHAIHETSHIIKQDTKRPFERFQNQWLREHITTLYTWQREKQLN